MKMSDLSELNSNPEYDFVIKEEEIIVKGEFDSSLQNESEPNPVLCKCVEGMKLLGESSDKYIRKTACLKHKVPESFPAYLPMNSKTKEPSLSITPAGPDTKGDSCAIYNLVKNEDMMDIEVPHLKRHLLMLKMCEEPRYGNDCDVVKQLEERNITCDVPSPNTTLYEREQYKPSPCEYFSWENDNSDKSIMIPTGEALFEGATREHSIVRKRLHIADNVLQSDLCPYNAMAKKTLIKHLQTNYEVELVKCEMGQYSTAYSDRSIQHMKTRANGDIYANSIRKKSSLAFHVRISTSGRQFKCQMCLYSAVRKYDLTQHIRTHIGERRFNCGFCDYKASRKTHLVLHLHNHLEEKPFKCNLCYYSASSKSTLVTHIRIHTGERPFKCEVCDYKASKKATLVRHIRIHTGVKPFKCELCDYSASHKVNLVHHMRTHTGEKPFKCELCPYSASQKFNLVQHIHTHTGIKPFKCELCNYCSSGKSYLVTHMRTHTGVKPFKCSLCNYCASRKYDLETHVRNHTGKKSFKCELCDYSASGKSVLVTHMRSHTGERPFHCGLCDYSSSIKPNLVKHIRIHLGDRPFRCGLCKYRASEKAHLVSHSQTHMAKKP